MKFNRDNFFAGYRAEFGPLTQQQVNGLTFILDSAEKDRHLARVEDMGYMLATTKHETADTFQPIHEYGGHAYFVRRYGGQTALGRRLGNDTPEEGALYAGVGDVQLTGEANFERAEIALRREYPELVADFERRTGRRFDLTVGDQPDDQADPQNAGDPAIAYAIMSFGMRTGMFTGKKLSDYDLKTPAGRKGARRIINGLDHADRIASSAEKFNKILQKALTSSTAKPTPDANLDYTSDDPGAASSINSAADGSTTAVANANGQSDPGNSPAAGDPQPGPTNGQQSPISLVSEPAIPVQTITAPPTEPKPEEESTLTKIGNKANAAYNAFGAMVAGVIAWFSTSSGTIALSIMGAIVVLGGLYMIINAIRAGQKDKRDREEKLTLAKIEADERQKREDRAHEVQMALINSAARQDHNTVALVPPPTEAGS